MLGELAIFILKIAFSIVLIALAARFLAQIARADVYNPLAQTVLTITSPFLKPLRRIIPSVAGLDLAALVSIWIGQIVLALLIFALMGGNPLNTLAPIVLWALIAVAGLFLTVLKWSMIIVIIASWLSMAGVQQNPMIGFVAQITEPFVGPFRRMNLQVGMLDLSYLVAIVVLIILQDFLLRGLILPSLGYNLRGFSLFIGI